MKLYTKRNIKPGKITSIRRQKQRSSRVSIHIEDKFAFGIPEEVLLELGWRNGDELDEGSIEQALLLAEKSGLKDKCLRLLSYRPHTRMELIRKLRNSGYPPLDINKVIDWLEENNLIDDRKFASMWVSSHLEKKRISKRALQRYLIKKGVAKNIIEESLEGRFSEEDEINSAYEVIVNRINKSRKDETKEKNRDRIFGYLYNHGWDLSTIKKAWRMVEENEE